VTVAKNIFPKSIVQQISKCVEEYSSHRTEFFNLARRVENDLVENQNLKNPKHLRDKLERIYFRLLKEGKKFDIMPKNLFHELDDLAGVRILHIHREQLKEIDPLIRETLKHHKYILREDPKAYTWDEENKDFFDNLGFKVETKATFYTSVHYVVQPHWADVGCELQVRSLAEELWGEVSHQIEYPHPSGSKACDEQIKVLARVASGCTRLVDSIFASRDEYLNLTK
jgi:putative GTP pyrophosphokinase